MSINSISNTLSRQNAGYKGTAFGDPAETANASKPAAAKSYPVEYKGTAFGDPAVVATNPKQTQTAASKSYPVDFKGTAFGDPAVTAKSQAQETTAAYTVAASGSSAMKSVSMLDMQNLGNRMDIRA
jgi:hypothetical protein